MYAPGSIRWGDPRAELLSPETWDQQRDQACEDLALDTDPANVVAHLAQALDEAWRRAADGMAANPDFRIEHRDGADRVVVTPLDAVDEPASLVHLRAMVEALLPEVEIADLPLEVHGWTGFLDEYTHISGAASRAGGLVESVSALLVADACNVGLTPVIDENYPPLSRDRLNWTAHNYVRSMGPSAIGRLPVDRTGVGVQHPVAVREAELLGAILPPQSSSMTSTRRCDRRSRGPSCTSSMTCGSR